VHEEASATSAPPQHHRRVGTASSARIHTPCDVYHSTAGNIPSQYVSELPNLFSPGLSPAPRATCTTRKCGLCPSPKASFCRPVPNPNRPIRNFHIAVWWAFHQEVRLHTDIVTRIRNQVLGKLQSRSTKDFFDVKKAETVAAFERHNANFTDHALRQSQVCVASCSTACLVIHSQSLSSSPWVVFPPGQRGRAATGGDCPPPSARGRRAVRRAHEAHVHAEGNHGASTHLPSTNTQKTYTGNGFI
jgi:hypothetical protein